MGSFKANHLNIVSSNVRGLRNKNKCQALFKALVESDVHVCLLQETYFTDDTKEWVENMYGNDFKCISSYGSNHSRGVSVLVKNMSELKIVNKRCDNEGRLILLNLAILDELCTVVNVYAPNTVKERGQLFNKIDKWLCNYAESSENCIVGGDFNLVQNPEMDRKHGAENMVDRSKGPFDKMCNKYQLCDVWRIKNKQKIQYTCRVQSRIDLILCTKSIVNRVTSINIRHPFVYSDHQLLFAKLNVVQHIRGPGYWKLNCSVLSDDNYRSEMKSMLCKIRNEGKLYQSNQRLWEVCKTKVKEFTIAYCKRKYELEKMEEKMMEAELAEIEQNLHVNWCKDLETRKSILLNSLESHYLKRARAAQVRARAQWVEEGEKSTKFFLGLEKQHQIHNTIKALKVEDRHISDMPSIINEVVRFYTDLYSSSNVNDDIMDEYLDRTVIENSLSDSDISSCEGLLTNDECTETINRMKKNKSPGNDGLPVEFYQVFWNEIKSMVINALNEAYALGELSSSQKRAIITLMYKKGDPELLKNWRPISLLNTDYKIAAFVIANRLQNVLSKLISKDQSGYIRGRSIGTNIRLIDDVFEYVEKNKLDGAVVFCDFEKAFDTVEIPFVIKTLQKFKFGSGLQRWISMFYNNVNACVKCNNWISSSIKVKRGIRQGCPVSALLFVMVVEIMAINIRQNNSIKGIRLPGSETAEAKISQLADDTTVFLNDSTSVVNVLQAINAFGRAAGMKLNVKKTVGVWLGSLKDSSNSVGGITWTSDLVKALGVYFGHDVKKKIWANWHERLAQVENCLKLWDKRNITLLGRILIVKTFAVSKLTFLSSVMECTESYLKQINRTLFNFIWKGKRDHVKRDTMIASKIEGGLKMVDFRLKDKALKVMMLKKILEPGNENWKSIPLSYLNKLGSISVLLNVHMMPKECTKGEIYIPAYYKEMLIALNSCKNRNRIYPSSVIHVREQVIWGNQWIKCKGKPLWFERWINSNIIFVNDLFDSDGNFDEVAIFKNVKNKTDILAEMYKVKNSVPDDWKRILQQDPCKIVVKQPSELNITFLRGNHLLVLKDIKSSREVYNLLVNINKKPPCTKVLWNNIFSDKNIIWQNVYQEKLCNVKEQKIIAFNFKILNNILATPYKLKKWNLIDSDICHLCFSLGDLHTCAPSV